MLMLYVVILLMQNASGKGLQFISDSSEFSKSDKPIMKLEENGTEKVWGEHDALVSLTDTSAKVI
ncbi:hypothetical protein SAY86_014295 [Trapa natans]|uniref:Uncharacterized protein n=1 Tax=Trapa natans TaxID=22666 RepID=A0AAN7QR93_TRANT|nr:hypothetical protein SAY86_014295 [Trapa natans]